MDLTIKHNENCVEYLGRWEVMEKWASTTACGSSFRVGFWGRAALLCFDLSECATPPHIYVSVDGGAKTECAVSEFVRIWAPCEGKHCAEVVMKSSVEAENRWTAPNAKVVFLGVSEAVGAEVEPDCRPVMEFVGDSVSEGSSVYPWLTSERMENWYENLLWTNDVCSAYAWQTAELLNLRPAFMAYGGSGVTVTGCGGVPPCPDAYGYLREGVPYGGRADYVVINHGANDFLSGAEPEKFLKAYGRLLDTVREHNPDAVVISVRPYIGAYKEHLPRFIAQYNEEKGANVGYIDTEGWISPEPLHPYIESTRRAAKRLADEIKKIM